jgi:two-component system, chemotaxis family, chemotaxis protein CheY
MVMKKHADLRNLQLLLVGGRAASVQVLRTAFGLIGINQVTVIAEGERAIEALRIQSFSAIFCDAAVEPYKGMSFPMAARRASGVVNPMTPLFVIYANARQRQVEQARDVGVTDVLTHPVSAATIQRKLEIAMAAPRPFIAASTFFGPDRRTRRQAAWNGVDRRTRVTKKSKVVLPEPGSSNDLTFV